MTTSNKETAETTNRDGQDSAGSAGGIVLTAERLVKQVSSPEGSLTILDDVSFDVSQGESVAVVGVSGAGKSTLLGLLAGLDVPTSGRVVLEGNDLSTLDEDGRAAVRADHVGFVFQSFHLIPSLTALENVMLPLELAGHRDPAGSARAALEQVGLGPRLGHYPRQLSGGEKQRVAIARAFVIDPRVLFADEPTGNLDQRTGEAIVELLFRLNRDSGATLVLVTHDLDLAQRCDRILHMEAGRLDREERGRETAPAIPVNTEAQSTDNDNGSSDADPAPLAATP